MHAVIIGNGITGVSAAFRLRQRQPDWRITMISGESTYHYSRPALMYIFMGHMRYADTKPYEDHVWARQRIELRRDWVTRIDVPNKTLNFHRAKPLGYDKLLIAVGSRPNKFGWPGQDLDGVQGLYDLMDLRRLYDTVQRVRRAVIVGGGLIGLELAEMLHGRGIHVCMLVREPSYWSHILPPEESSMVNRVIEASGIELRLSTEMQSVQDDGQGMVASVTTVEDKKIDCQLVGLTAGVHPNIDLVKSSDIACGSGVLVDAQLRTALPDVFAAGDCAEIVSVHGGPCGPPPTRQSLVGAPLSSAAKLREGSQAPAPPGSHRVCSDSSAEGDLPGRERFPEIETAGEQRNLLQQVWYTGKMQGEVAADNMAGDERVYDPGIWFNSAKFLDLEYQVYGDVGRKLDGEKQLFWQHSDGKHALRIVYDDRQVRGFNVMGMRWRHELCERWIREATPVEEVLPQLAQANFDPELFARHEAEMAASLRSQLS